MQWSGTLGPGLETPVFTAVDHPADRRIMDSDYLCHLLQRATFGGSDGYAPALRSFLTTGQNGCHPLRQQRQLFHRHPFFTGMHLLKTAAKHSRWNTAFVEEISV